MADRTEELEVEKRHGRRVKGGWLLDTHWCPNPECGVPLDFPPDKMIIPAKFCSSCGVGLKWPKEDE